MTLENEILGEHVRKSLREYSMKTFELEFKLDLQNSQKNIITSELVTAKIPIVTNLTLNIYENISHSKTHKLIIRNNVLELSIPVEEVSSNLGIESKKLEREIENYFRELDFQVRLIVESYRSVNR